MAAAWLKLGQTSFIPLVYLASLAVLMVPVSRLWHSMASQPGGVAHMHLFMHDVLTGENPTATAVVNGTGKEFESVALRFGHVVVMDDLLTEGPSPTSRSLGRAQGFYIFSAMDEPALLVSMNVVPTTGPYSGSTVTVAGRDNITLPVRELSVVGGTGMFRMASGYILWRTANWELLQNAVLELDFFIHMHPSVHA